MPETHNISLPQPDQDQFITDPPAPSEENDQPDWQAIMEDTESHEIPRYISGQKVETYTVQAPSVRLITDLETCIKAQENLYYAQKVKVSNLKEMANTLSFLKENGIGTVEELSSLVSASSKDVESKRLALKATEEKLNAVNLLIRNSAQYFANKKVYGEYLEINR